MPRLLTPYENTLNGARLNAEGQITRRQFEMLIDPESGPTRRGVRHRRRLIVWVGLSFLCWAGLYWLGLRGHAAVAEWSILCGGLLLLQGIVIIGYGLLRILYGVLAITPTPEDLGEGLRKRIRDRTLSIEQLRGRLKLHHLLLGRGVMLCSLVIGRQEFPISQALWEVLHERKSARDWVLFYLRDPFALLSVLPRDELAEAHLNTLDGESIVTGKTISRREVFSRAAPRGESPQSDSPHRAP